MNTNHTLVFDCETGPLGGDYLNMVAPEFEAPSNYKDEFKIAAHIAEQKSKWIDQAALDPRTGKILVIGIRGLDGSFRAIDGGGDEATLLQEFSALVAANGGKIFAGFNIKTFDIPFLVKRMWRLGVSPFLRPGASLRYLDNWIDLRDVWQMGDKQAGGSLDAIAKFFGIGAKTGHGKEFANLWKADRAAALAYLENDVQLTYDVGVRMGVIL